MVCGTNYLSFQVNLYQKCQFWSEIGVCGKKTCTLKTCDKKDVPEGIANHQEVVLFVVSIMAYLLLASSMMIHDTGRYLTLHFPCFDRF